MTTADIMAALAEYDADDHLRFQQAYEAVYCRDCGGLIKECGCWKCKTCGHYDKLNCICAAKRREERQRKLLIAAKNVNVSC